MTDPLAATDELLLHHCDVGRWASESDGSEFPERERKFR
jgi:hypothetical protein